MRNAAKNILFTYCNTYYIAKEAGTDLGVSTKQNLFPVWILMPIGLTLAYISGATIYVIKQAKKKKKYAKKKHNSSF